MNRKLIRTTLAEVKGRGEGHPREREGGAPRGGGGGGGSFSRGGGGGGGGGSRERDSSGGPSSSAAALGRKKVPPIETNAEIFYYKKQMDAHTLMVIVLQDGEEIEGTIEWYDRSALKVNRRGEPNLMILKHNIKYMFKADERDGSDEEDDGDEDE